MSTAGFRTIRYLENKQGAFMDQSNQPTIADIAANVEAVAPPLLGKKVLCIEDEYFIGELYTRALEKAGAQVKLVITGDEGLNTALSNAYDIIVLDLMLPNINGQEVLDKILGAQPKITAKIFFVTNAQQPDLVRERIESQVAGYFIKAEITPKQLVQALAAN
jgi:CheY-like chemotaxis protein